MTAYSSLNGNSKLGLALLSPPWFYYCPVGTASDKNLPYTRGQNLSNHISEISLLIRVCGERYFVSTCRYAALRRSARLQAFMKEIQW